MLTYILGFYKGFVGYFAFADEHVGLGEVGVDVFVVALDGVGGAGVDNISRTVEGVLRASQIEIIKWVIDTSIWKFGELEINITATIVRSWGEYEEVVQTSSNGIIVNAHGETIPVPSGYSKEAWVDKIAEAMLNRNVTWVHTGGYPFFYTWDQDLNDEEFLGELGFQKLVNHIGKDNATCYPPGSKFEKVPLYDITQHYLLHNWPGLANAFRVERWNPIKASDFGDCVVNVIWGSPNDYMTGAIISFAKSETNGSFGFYVHIGAGQTYSSQGEVESRDFYRGYAGAAQAIFTVGWRLGSEKAISEAERAIKNAESEGRTKGLDSAGQLLNNARYQHNFYIYWKAALIANEAKDKADDTVEPSWVESNLPYLTFLGIISIGGITAIATRLIIRRKKTS